METVKNYIKSFGKGFFNNLFERSIRVYIQKHLGEFLLYKLSTDQVDIGLDGGSLASLYLNAEAINERLEDFNMPFTLVDGYVETLHLHIPWADISTESIKVEVDGLLLTIKLKETEIEDGIDVKSMFESMTASMVEEVMKTNTAEADIEKISQAGKAASPFESVELMSEFISSITSRIQVTLLNVMIKTEQSPGVSLELHVDRLEYSDKDSIISKEKTTNVAPTNKGYSTKILKISNVKLSLEEIWSRECSPKPMDPIQQSTVAFDIAMSSPPTSGNYMHSSMTQSIYPGMASSLTAEETAEPESGGRIPILVMDKTQTVTIDIKNEEQLPGPNVDVSWHMESLHVLMSPKLLGLLTKFLNSDVQATKKAKQVPMTDEEFEFCRRLAMEEERQRADSGHLDMIDVPPLTMDKHMEMMQGATADSLLTDDDMFFSAYPTHHKSSLSTFDVSDSASVSTFAGHSTFSTANASAFSHNKKSKAGTERTMSNRSWEDHTVETQRINMTVPFFTVTLLLEDPELCTVIPGATPAPPPPTTSSSSHSCPPSSSFPPKSSSIHLPSFGASSLPKSFISNNPNFPQLSNPVMPSLSSNHTQRSFSAEKSMGDKDNDVDGDDDDEEEEFHDSGDFFYSTHASSVDELFSQDKTKSTETAAESRTFQTREKSPPKSTATVKEPVTNKDVVTNHLQEVATKFFEAIAKLETRLPLNQLRDRVAEILPLDHLGLIAKPVQVFFSQDKRAMETKQSVKITFGKLEVIECLFDCFSNTSDFAKTALPKLPQYSETRGTTGQQRRVEVVKLLTFDVNGQSESTGQFDPKTLFNVDRPRQPQSALSFSIDSVQRKRQHKESPSIKLSFDFGKLTSEVDVTIIDRLTNLINLQSGTGAGPTVATQLVDDNYGHIDEAIKDDQTGGRLQPDIHIRAVHASLRLRFPIPDLSVDRPTQTRDWWRRNLHKEVLLLEMEAPEARSRVTHEEPWQLEVQVFKISAYLQEDINTQPILFGEVTVDDAKATALDGHHFNWPRLVICVSNKANSALEAEEESDTSAHSMDAYLDTSFYKKESGPFSKKKSLYERDDLSFSEQAPANDEMVMPGDATELKQFREECLNRTCLSIDITVPCVTAFMPSREFLELLYNRFNNDLLMWEPQQPRPHTYMSTAVPSSVSLGVLHMFPQQMSDPSSSADYEPSESEDDESMHYSIHDQRSSNKADKPSSPKLLNKMCFSLAIGNGRLLAVVPHADQENQPSVHGEVMITLKDGLLFSVNQYNGDPDLKYLCFQVNKAHMYHNSCVMLPVEPGTLDHIRDKIPQYLKSRIYRSDRGTSDKLQGMAGFGDNSPDMLTLVVKTKVHSLDNVKNFTVAMRLEGATLRHEMHRSGESWISQAIDLLDLKDFPIKGYTWPKIMTELHLQIDHCCIDYRPIYLPVWSFLTVEHFSVCTNIIAESSFSQVRLLLEDSALFLSKKCNQKEVNLLRDYVCVAEMDQFKIWLQFCYQKSGKQKCPKSDLRFMVNELNLRTCADSTRALLDLIQYLVTDGDLIERMDEQDITPTSTEDGNQFFNQGEDSGDSQIPSPVLPVPAITPEQEASVMSALEDAISDCPEASMLQPPPQAKKGKGQVTRVFFQCENGAVELHSQLEDAMHINISDSSDSSTPDYDMGEAKEEEFELIDCNFKEVTNMKGSHEVHKLTEEGVDVRENFIPKPSSSYDHLQAPDKFPDPEYQYTLREMSVVWHIYGGSDFSQPRRGSSSDRVGLAKGLQSPRDQRRLSDMGGKSKHAWRRRGGDWRDFDVLMELDLNKIRFRNEVYPTITKQSSRFKLLVNNIELRDRIKLSEVNKFLVKLVDKEHPEQSSAYMLMFSGVFTRPEHLPFREECEVKAFCLPIKLNIDQVSLNFLRKFVTQLSDPDPEVPSSGASGGRSSPLGGQASPSGGRASPRASVSNTDPIMRVGEPSKKESSMDETELLMKFEEMSNKQSLYLQSRLNENDNLELPQEDLPVFIKSFVLISDITIKLDYRGKRCDMDTGMVGVMLGVASLTGSIVRLKKLNCQKGILGWNKLLMYVANEWLADIKTNQIHSILKGVGSLSILFQIFQGVTDLVRLPIEQYQKDRRIIRGLQRGANSFTLNTVMAILELTNKVVGSIQYCAELGYDMMSPGPSVRRRKQIRHRNRQPRTAAEGAKTAFQLMTEGVKESASNLSATVSEESAHKGYVGLVGGTLRTAAPECLFKPLALLAEAGTNIVQGARNEVDPSVMKEEEDRWKQA